jgi:hypothetical protein
MQAEFVAKSQSNRITITGIPIKPYGAKALQVLPQIFVSTFFLPNLIQLQ